MVHLGSTLRAAGEACILHRAFAVGLTTTFAGRKSGDITFGCCGLFAVFFLLVIGDEGHINYF